MIISSLEILITIFEPRECSSIKVCFPCCDPCDSRSAMIALKLSHGSQQGK